MRLEARLNAIHKQRQAIADRKMAAILRDLHLWSDEDLTAALKECMKQQEYQDNPQEVDRLFLPENEAELTELLRADSRAEMGRV